MGDNMRLSKFYKSKIDEQPLVAGDVVECQFFCDSAKFVVIKHPYKNALAIAPIDCMEETQIRWFDNKTCAADIPTLYGDIYECHNLATIKSLPTLQSGTILVRSGSPNLYSVIRKCNCTEWVLVNITKNTTISKIECSSAELHFNSAIELLGDLSEYAVASITFEW